ncbi:DUF4097 family beta strand repeat-containing protein [Intrasporangium sp.]|uniref:DUF4097 family beta strand repeat-containing protein n=1 Tax=Intrasporangium sp. TaxID=1925024 RepID=UPI00293AAB9A|nr:DUF4097 family beta strand repeat-containing protein [Intrasporangium sp.]MDV3220245.1 DUF4097 domain-containing protein [Intrasporangium sp.]
MSLPHAHSFETPEAIHALIDIGVGEIVVMAVDTTRTSVEVRPAREGRRNDIDQAEGTTVTFADGRLGIKAPKQRLLGLLGRPGAVIVTVELPSGSDVEATAGVGDIEIAGTVHRCRARTQAGDVRVEDAEVLEAQSSAGDVMAGRAGASATLQSLAGGVRLEEVTGTARIKSSAGEVELGTVAGEVTATAPYGQVRVRRAVSGSLNLTTSYADIEVGIPEGTAARLDVSTEHGRIRNELTSSGVPSEGLERVLVEAHTSYGSITVRRP